MKLKITHESTYRFERPVFFEPHTVRLLPRATPNIAYTDFSIDIDPTPHSAAMTLDHNENPVAELAFKETHALLSIQTTFSVTNTLCDPFAYLCATRAATLPPRYDEHESRVLAPCLSAIPLSESEKEQIDGIVNETLAAIDSRFTPAFLLQLTFSLAGRFRTTVRDHGEPWPPGRTLASPEATCRDITVLFLAICRTLGIAARFVSGYQAGDTNQQRRDLHAWAEVYLPGGGWRAFDPTLGLAVADAHIPLAAAASPIDAAPVTGTYRGNPGEVELVNRITLEHLDDERGWFP